MKLLSIEDLRLLAGHHRPPCISILAVPGGRLPEAADALAILRW